MEKTGTPARGSMSPNKPSSSSTGSVKSPKKLKAVGEDGETAARQELFKPFVLGQNVWAMNKGSWYKSKVVEVSEEEHPEVAGLMVPTYLIHYTRWAARYDEWLMGDSMMDDSPSSDAKAEIENKNRAEELKGEKKAALAKAGGGKEKKNTVSAVKSNKEKSDVIPAESSTMTTVKKTNHLNVSKTIPAKLTTPSKRSERSERSERSVVGVARDAETTPRVSPTTSTSTSISTEVEVEVEGEGEGEGEVERVKSESGTRDEQVVSGPPSVEPPPESRKRERSVFDFNLLCDEYDACDGVNGDGMTAQEELALLEMQSSLGIVPDVPTEEGDAMTSAERQKTAKEAMRKLSLIYLAKRQKQLDTTVLRVTLPPGLKHLMARNYIQTVQNGQILKSSDAKYSMETILTAYRKYCEKNPRQDKSIYWNRARLAETAVFHDTDVFLGLLPSFLMRHEHPQMDDWKKSWKKDKTRDGFQKYGFLHLARYIQLMVAHHNTEPKRIIGKMGQQLMAIYDDLLNFIDREFVAKLTDADLEDMYQEMDAGYVARIKFVTYGTTGSGQDDGKTPMHVVHPFHMLSEGFFDELERVHKDTTVPLALKVVWKRAPTESEMAAAKAEAGSV